MRDRRAGMTASELYEHHLGNPREIKRVKRPPKKMDLAGVAMLLMQAITTLERIEMRLMGNDNTDYKRPN